MEIELKKTTTTTKTKKVKIELPYYSKSICHWYKVIDENTVIQITLMSYTDSNWNNSIQFSSVEMALSNKKTTENEFLKAYNKVLNQIQKHI